MASVALDDVQDIPRAEYQDRDHEKHHNKRDGFVADHFLDVLTHIVLPQFRPLKPRRRPIAAQGGAEPIRRRGVSLYTARRSAEGLDG